MKKVFFTGLMFIFAFVLIACGTKEETVDYSGVYTGYSWKDEVKGVAFEDATEYIETTLHLSKEGIIEDASIDFKMKKGDVWISRLDTTAEVSVDFDVTPTAATPGTAYVPGTSMFSVTTNALMSFYAVAVDTDGTVAVLLVDPITRYQFEMKIPSDFDFTTLVGDFTIGSGLIVPTVRTAGGALINPTSWDNLATKTFFNISGYSHVVKDTGVFEGVSNSSTIQFMLEKLGVTFVDGKATEMAVDYGFFGLGGWAGNYSAIRQFLIGKSALEVLSLVDWTFEDYVPGINDQNQFGVDVPAGVTRTAQDSYDTIAGATVRMSRESESYQKALVAAGILTLDQVIFGRF
jgi:hypothetical protein